MICVNNKVSFTTLLISGVCGLLIGCSTMQADDEDPLKYSRKLIKEGHSSLYHHGAFEVPNTRIKLIPAGPEPLELAGEMMGMRARQAFTTSVKNAADAVYLVPAGSKLSLEYGKDIFQGGQNIGSSVTDVTRPSGTWVVSRSSEFGKKILLDSWQHGKSSAHVVDELGVGIEKGALKTGDVINTSSSTAGKEIIGSSFKGARKLSHASTHGAKKSLLYAGNRFIKGYAAVPEKLGERAEAMGDAVAIDNFTEGWVRSNERRAEYSVTFTELLGDTVSNYTENVGESFKKAGEAFDDTVDVSGFSFALLKSVRWVLQGLLWDGLVEPAAKLGAGSVGYVAVNAVAFPAMVIVEEGIAVTKLAVEVTWNTAGAVYDLVAPTAVSAVAAIYSVFQFTGGNLAAGATAAGGAVIGGAEYVAGQAAGYTVKGVGYVAGKSVQYIGVPLTAAGVTVGSGAVGVVAGGAGAVAGSAVVVTGEAASLTAQGFGTVLAGTTVVAGTTASVVAGTAVGVYELTKAVVVPAGYELGGGIVLGYGTMAQLGAHTVLAVADASYLVLSLEGPRWVVYAVKGNLGDGEELPIGTVLDLEAMQDAGEEFSYLPVSDEEMNSVVNGIYQELPVKSDIEDDSF